MQKTSGKPFLKWKLETGLKSDTKRVRHGSRFTEQRPKLSKVRKQQFPQFMLTLRLMPSGNKLLSNSVPPKDISLKAIKDT